MKPCIDGAWEEFEEWIRDTIGSDFRWRIRPIDTPIKRRAIAESIQNIINRHGEFPEDAYEETFYKFNTLN